MARIRRLNPMVRKAQILAMGAKLARKSHYKDVSRKRLATALDVSPPLISKYFASREDLAQSIYEYAVAREIVEVVAQKIPPAQPLPSAIKKKLKKYLASSL